MRQLPDLVKDSELETSFPGGLTVHFYNEYIGRRRVRREERWRQEKYIGRGSFGNVHLEQRVGGDSHDVKLRAVKTIGKSNLKDSHFVAELEAMMKFSHLKVMVGSASFTDEISNDLVVQRMFCPVLWMVFDFDRSLHCDGIFRSWRLASPHV